MDFKVLLLTLFMLCSVTSSSVPHQHLRTFWKRFIDSKTSSNFGSFNDNDVGKTRTRRSSEDECEQLNLCLLHARSAHSFLAAFELYFVNKENARLWDHAARSRAACERRFTCYN